MIEALDAFAVRAKLTGSNTAMGRFMVQLFGSKREPWVEGAGGDRTQVTEPGRRCDQRGEDDVDRGAQAAASRTAPRHRRSATVASRSGAERAAARAAAMAGDADPTPRLARSRTADVAVAPVSRRGRRRRRRPSRCSTAVDENRRLAATGASLARRPTARLAPDPTSTGRAR
jgi:hypothetical protein